MPGHDRLAHLCPLLAAVVPPVPALAEQFFAANPSDELVRDGEWVVQATRPGKIGRKSAESICRHVRQRMGDVSERRAYVPVADIARVIEHCPNVWWKLLVALARFGGLRIPSEAFSPTWGDVDWERNRLTVPSPKTRSHGKPRRVSPLFTLVRPHLEAAFDHAEAGSAFVIPKEYRERAEGEREWGGANLRTQFGKIVRRAGVDPWPRLWHSLRASCESDLAQSFPLATVTKWLGNTPSVALRHYVDPTEAAFDRAVNWTPESGAAGARGRSHRNAHRRRKR